MRTKILIGAVLLAAFILLACGGNGIIPTPTASIRLTPKTFRGVGDDVIECGDLAGYTKVHLTHDGTRNFIVVPYDGRGERLHSLVNEIGSYDGTVKWDGRARSLEVRADGGWVIVASQ